jgi:hypothetical protein
LFASSKDVFCVLIIGKTSPINGVSDLHDRIMCAVPETKKSQLNKCFRERRMDMRRIILTSVMILALLGTTCMQSQAKDVKARNKGTIIQVYDSSSPPQYLGILCNWPNTIFIPKLSLFASIGTLLHRFNAASLYYESYDCTGQPYIYGEYGSSLWIVGDDYYQTDDSGYTYVAINSVSSINSADLQWHCYAYNGGTLPVFPAVQVPIDDLPFNLPIVPPLKYVVDER